MWKIENIFPLFIWLFLKLLALLVINLYYFSVVNNQLKFYFNQFKFLDSYAKFILIFKATSVASVLFYIFFNPESARILFNLIRNMSLPRDILGVIRGFQVVAQAGIKLQESTWKEIWVNSSVRGLTEECLNNARKSSTAKADKNSEEFAKIISESGDRFYTVIDGVKQYLAYSTKAAVKATEHIILKETPVTVSTKPTKQEINHPSVAPQIKSSDLEIKLTASDKALLKKLDMEHREKLKAAAAASSPDITEKKIVPEQATVKKKSENVQKEKGHKIKAVPNPKARQSLSSSAKERPVPSSRIARMVSFGSLAAGLGVGTAAEFMRRSVGIGNNSDTASNMFLTQANMDRIVDTLCKVRGAALKIGQMLSIQDESIVSPELAKALERVRKSADFMPSWQVAEVMRTQIGETWRQNLSEFEEKPFAAASIGQVHWGKTTEGQEVAIKIQYPGVAKGIESDIDNLVGIMKVWNIFPKGMFIDNVVVVAKRELAWEVDYIREAECTKKFRELLKPYPDFHVPKVIDNLCGSQVFTTELIEGTPVDQCVNLDVEHRKFIANKVMELCLRELMEFRYMQTDPNWANFFYNPKTRKICLLDFGASREYPKAFVDKYVQIIKAASENDRKTVLNVSRELGFLTGYESKVMDEAHVDAVMILGEAFQASGDFNFSGQDTILRIQNLVPTMITHRLCPPPEEVYSLHRKLSGVFLLCAKLNVAISARPLFLDMYSKYKFDPV